MTQPRRDAMASSERVEMNERLTFPWRTRIVHERDIFCECGYMAKQFGDGGVICTKCGHMGRREIVGPLPADTPTPERLRAWAEWFERPEQHGLLVDVGDAVTPGYMLRRIADVTELWLADALEASALPEEGQ